MAASRMMGIVFPNTRDNKLGGLTLERSTGSLPFASRYRLIDFALSRMVHARVHTVGVIMQHNYRSLMEHIGSGKEWDLSRKRGGITFFPPYSGADAAGLYRGSLEALAGIQSYLKQVQEEYVVVTDCDIICSVDLNQVLEYHIAKGAAITLICSRDPHDSAVRVTADQNGALLTASHGEGDLMFDNMYIISRQLLLQLVKEAANQNRYSFVDTCLIKPEHDLPIYCYEYEGFCRHIDSLQAYFDISMSLLDPGVRRQIFCPERPIYTRVRDEVPVKYGLSADVANSLVADGCIIEGHVENCIVFRGVHIGRGAVVKNSILMQSGTIGNGASLDYCICDRDVLVSANRHLAGCANFPLYLPRDTHV